MLWYNWKGFDDQVLNQWHLVEGSVCKETYNQTNNILIIFALNFNLTTQLDMLTENLLFWKEKAFNKTLKFL